ncbi:MAG: transposase [Anaerolineae bacterium]|nr:transposase [Anaerolineae bacterium]
MTFDPHKHHRRSIRLKGYDYSQAGAYFVTICINHGQPLLGEVQNGIMIPSPAGIMVAECWQGLTERFPNIEQDVFSLMPNHFHGNLLILETGLNAKQNPVVLGNMVGAFKSISTHQYIQGVQEQGWEPFKKRLWQRNFYERIIRNERELEAIRTYIINNPAHWDEDKLHPDAPPNEFNRDWQRP